MVGAIERVLELMGPHARERQLAAEVASAATAVQHAVEFPGPFEVAAAKVRAGEAAAAVADATGDRRLDPYTLRLRSWRDDFGDGSEWARLLGRSVLADPGLLWGHAPARGTD
jgi:hypothetical protein